MLYIPYCVNAWPPIKLGSSAECVCKSAAAAHGILIDGVKCSTTKLFEGSPVSEQNYIARGQGTICSQVISRIAPDLPSGARAYVLHNIPQEDKTVEINPVNSWRCKAAAQTPTTRLVTTTSLPLRRAEINLHPQQVTVELLVEGHGTTYLPDAAKAQVTDQLDVPRDEVLRKVDIERPEGLLHDQEQW